jgi:tetratricopeptide (TPR) repeat protein/transcriptional regulator with XRE-family HTH domain
VNDPFQLAIVLGRYAERSGYSAGQLARLSGVPKATLVNWLAGRVRKPRHWQDLARLAAVLHLGEEETTALLRAAGHPALEELRTLVTDPEQQALLASWTGSTRQRPAAVPFQTIADLPYFVGREEELQALEAALLTSGPVKICSVEGMAGVGKTALVARAAYRLRSHFTDGVLWARLDTSDTTSVLSTFAEAYGRELGQYPDLESRSRVVRELLAHKRALLVLDDVSRSEQVRPLLPPSGECAVILTTRRHDLSVTRGVHRLHLHPFSPEKREALQLFARMLGRERVRHEESALVEIADLLGHLPLAIAIAAGRLANEPGRSAADFVTRVRQQQRRLNELTYEDQRVRLSFSLSYGALGPDEQRCFAALGVFGGEDFGPEAVAYVTGRSLEETQDGLRRLYGLSLVQQGGPGRYRLHPLLRDYARERIGDGAIYARMVEYFVRYVAAHKWDYAALEREVDNVLAALDMAFQREMWPLLIRGAGAFSHFLESKGMYGLAEFHLGRAEQAARSAGDDAVLVTVLFHRGRLSRGRGSYDQAEAQLREGLALARELGHNQQVSELLGELGAVAGYRGDYERAKATLQEGLALARQEGNAEEIVSLLTKLGALEDEHWEHRQAEAYYQEGLMLAQGLGQHRQVSILLNNLGAAALRRGDYKQAVAYLEEGLAQAREVGTPRLLSVLYDNLGEVALNQGDDNAAATYLQEGLALARQNQDADLLSELLRNLGVVALRRGDLGDAEVRLQESLELARQVEHSRLLGAALVQWGELEIRREETNLAEVTLRQALEIGRASRNEEITAMALYGLARIAAVQGNLGEANRQGQESLGLFEALDHPLAAQVAGWLSGLNAAQGAEEIEAGSSRR